MVRTGEGIELFVGEASRIWWVCGERVEYEKKKFPSFLVTTPPKNKVLFRTADKKLIQELNRFFKKINWFEKN